MTETLRKARKSMTPVCSECPKPDQSPTSLEPFIPDLVAENLAACQASSPSKDDVAKVGTVILCKGKGSRFEGLFSQASPFLASFEFLFNVFAAEDTPGSNEASACSSELQEDLAQLLDHFHHEYPRPCPTTAKP